MASLSVMCQFRIFALQAAWFLIFIFAEAATLLLKAFRPLGEILSFALPKESIQRKGNPIPLDSACAEQL